MLNFAHIFSEVSCRQSFLAVMLAVIMFSKIKRFYAIVSAIVE